MFTTADQWKFFAEFCSLEKRAGGPDPHLKLSFEMSKRESLEERFWRAGCYIAVYNAPFGEAIWHDWSWERVTAPDAERDLTGWLEVNFKKLITRRERRCVRRPEWMAEYLLSYRDLARRLPDVLHANRTRAPHELYEVLWEEANSVKRLGRYVALKLLEFYRVGCGVAAELPDLRARGGWSPREQLGYLFPDQAQVAERDDSDEMCALADRLANEAQRRLAGDFGVELDKFELQVLLCDFKQSWKGRRQYPGRSIDSEQEYAQKAWELWGRPSDVWRARRHLFLPEHLGEVQGWSGPRAEVAEVLARHKYTWSDALYDYRATRDFSRPVPRAAAPPVVSRGVWTILPGQLYQSGTWTKWSLERCRNTAEAYGLTGVVNVWKDDPRLGGVVPWYRHAWMSDGVWVPEDLLEGLVSSVCDRLQSGGRVLVMCQMGRNRSALVSALVVRRLLGCSGAEAVELLRRARPRALANDVFADWLCRLPPVEGVPVPRELVPIRGHFF